MITKILKTHSIGDHIAVIGKSFSKFPIWGVVAVALLIRLSFNLNIFFEEQFAFQSDSGTYLEPAEQILDSGGYDTILRTPGYPLFIALVWFLTPGISVISVILVQIILDAILVFVIANIKGFWIEAKALKKWGAWLYALNPLAIYYSGKIMSETLFVFFLVVSFYFLKKSIKQVRDWDWRIIALAGVFTVFAVLTRPVGLWFYLMFFIAIIIVSRREIKWRMLVLTAIMIISSFLWSWRNYEKTGLFIFSGASNYNLYTFGQSAYASAHGKSYSDVEKLFRPGLETIVAGKKMKWQESDRAGELGKKLVRDHPIAFAKISFLGWIKCAFQPGWGVSQLNEMIYRGRFEIESRNDKTNTSFKAFIKFPFLKRLWQLPFMGITLWCYGALYLILFYVYSAIKLKTMNDYKQRLLFVGSILFFILIAGPLGFSRFRFPAEAVGVA